MVSVLAGLAGLLLGLALGAIGMAVFTIVTAGNPEMRQDRDTLLEILTVQLGIEPKLANQIIESGLSPWANLREQSRPLLWRFSREWPEHARTLKQEFLTLYGRGLPELEPSDTPSDESPPEYIEEGPDISQPTRPEIATPSSSTSNSASDG
jgi:hypothetical protein